MMHDSRGAALKVGDRVLIEAEVTDLNGGDENYCCCGVRVVTPEQPGKDKVMQPPAFSAMSTKMLTKIGAVVLLIALLFAQAASAEPPAKSSDSPVSPPPAAAPKVVEADGIPAGHKLLYGLARAKAAKELAKKEGISRSAAREKIDDAIDDATLHALVQASGAVVVKAQPSGGKLGDFVDWLIAHQDQILAIVKIILALFSVNAEADTVD